MAFENLKNELRKKAALFEEGGLYAVKHGRAKAFVTIKPRRSVYEAGEALARGYPDKDLLPYINDHIKELGDKRYNREAIKFWMAVRHYCHCKALKITSDGLTIEFEIEEDAGEGWPPFEKPQMRFPRPAVEMAGTLELPPPPPEATLQVLKSQKRGLPKPPQPSLPKPQQRQLPPSDDQ